MTTPRMCSLSSSLCAGVLVVFCVTALSCVARSGDSADDQTLGQVVKAYEKAEAYADSGELHIRAKFKSGKTEEPRPVPFSVTYERPNKIRLHEGDLSAVCDGKLLRASVPDRPDQILQLKSPAELDFENVFPDPLLKQTIEEMGPPLVTVRLLLADDPLGLESGGGKRVERLEDKELAGQRCQRVQVSGRDGKTVYWIDPKDHVLLRVDFPTDDIKKNVGDPNISDVEVWAEFKGARLNQPIAEHAFEFEPPSTALLLNRFLPMPPEPPKVGMQLPPFSLIDLEGHPVNRESLSGKVVVLDLWATWCHWCLEGLPNLERVYQRYQDNPRVAILAVSTDDPGISDEQLRATFAKGPYHIPIVRDPENTIPKALNMDTLPITLVIGPDGSIQDLEASFNPNLAEELPKKLASVLAGKNLAQATVDAYEAKRKAYEAELRAALVGKTEQEELKPVPIAQRSEPTSLKLTKLWTASDLKNPGNLLVVEADDEQKILAIEGYRTVAELDVEGRVTARHELDIPEQAAITFLRTTRGTDLHHYLAFASGQQQFHLFDDHWKRLLSYPDSEHDGVSDVQLVDLDGSGHPKIYVGYWGVVGVQQVSDDGQREWSNRDFENVLRLAPTPPDEEGDRRLICTNGRGTLVVLDKDGKKTAEITVPKHAVHTIVAADRAAEKEVGLCGLSAMGVATTLALGLDSSGRELWSYRLPDGVHQRPVETIVWGHLKDGPGQWLFPGADGSVHILSAQGDLIDTFNNGALLTGLAAAKLADNWVLLVASTDGLTAWKVEE